MQTLHNYRLLCPGARFFRHGRVCEDCVGKALAWPGVVHGCYQGSTVRTAVVAAMLALHRWLKTWRDRVDVIIVLNELHRERLLAAGFPAEQIVVKPNCLNVDPGEREGAGDYSLFVGRLSADKGVYTMLRAWTRLRRIPLKIVGDGPELAGVRRFVRQHRLEGIELLERRSRDEVTALVKKARFLNVPSESYENFPMVIAEAFACGVPVIASRLGAMLEVVDDGRTGMLFTAGDPGDLAAKVEWAWSHPRETAEMGREARREYETKYTAERNYRMLMEIYEKAITRARARRA